MKSQSLQMMSDSEFVVTDTLAEEFGGEGKDTLVGVSSVSFREKYHDWFFDQSYELSEFGSWQKPIPSEVKNETIEAWKDDDGVYYEGQSVYLTDFPITRFKITTEIEPGLQKLIVEDLLGHRYIYWLFKYLLLIRSWN
jgi:hypothetical protein